MERNLHTENTNQFKDMALEEKIMWRTGLFGTAGKLSADEAFNKLIGKIDQPGNVIKIDSRKSVFSERKGLFSVAASLIVILLSTVLLWKYSAPDTVIAQKGEQTEFQLPDGSSVLLNADTKISYSKEQ